MCRLSADRVSSTSIYTKYIFFYPSRSLCGIQLVKVFYIQDCDKYLCMCSFIHTYYTHTFIYAQYVSLHLNGQSHIHTQLRFNGSGPDHYYQLKESYEEEAKELSIYE